MDIQFPWQKKPKVNYTTTARMDVTTVFYCLHCNLCQLRSDLNGEGHCGRCGREVQNVTDSPLGRSWREVVKPKPKKKES